MADDFFFNERTGEMQLVEPRRPTRLPEPSAPAEPTRDEELLDEEPKPAAPQLLPRTSGEPGQLCLDRMQARAAELLSWPLDQVRSMSLLALRDQVQPHSAKLAADLSRMIASGRHLIESEAEFPRGYDAPCERCGAPRLSTTERLCFLCEQEAGHG